MRTSCCAHVVSTRGAILSGPIDLLGFTCWNACQTSSSLVWSLSKSSSSADALLKTWICPCPCEKSWQLKRLKNWISSLASAAAFTEEIPFVTVYVPTHQPHITPHSGELRTQKLKSHLVRTRSLNILPLKLWVGQYIAMHATLTAGDFFLAYFYPSSPFTCIFSKTSPNFFLCWPAE